MMDHASPRYNAATPRYTGVFGGVINFRDRGRRMSNFRYAEIEIMEMLGGWSSSIIHIPLRIGFGYQMFSQAIHARDLGWALKNLKRTLQRQAMAPTDEFVRLCERIWSADTPLLRLVGVYRVLKPHLISAYLRHIDETDPVSDSHSIRVLRACIADHERDITWAQSHIERLANTREARSEAAHWQLELEQMLVASGGITAEGFAYTVLDDSSGLLGDSQERAKPAGYSYRKVQKLHAKGRQPFDSRFRFRSDNNEEKQVFKEGTPEWLLEGVHELYQGENYTVDRCGRFLIDFPELPFELRFDMAQQAWEEARHIEIDTHIIRALNGEVGMFALPHENYDAHMQEPDPLVRLVRDNAVFESNAARISNDWLAQCASWMPKAVRTGIEHLSGDELVHINYGNDWMMKLLGHDTEARRKIINKVRDYILPVFPEGEGEKWVKQLHERYKVAA